MAGDVLRKKLLAGQQKAAEGSPGADRAWRLAFARAARDMMKLPVDFLGLTVSRLSLAELLDLPPERALILMLEGPEEGLDLFILSSDLLSALVEVLTMGKCGAQPPDPRKPTRTDAAMLSPLADLALANLEELLAEESDLVWASGFRFASFIEEARPLGLMLEDVGYRVLTAQLSLFHSARQGEMIVVFPAEGRGMKPRAKSKGLPDSLSRPAFAAALTARVEAAECPLMAILARLSLPLEDITQLAVDTVLPLPSASLDQIRLEGMDGRQAALGRLGQQRSMRAIRLLADEGAGDGFQSDSGALSPASAAFAAPEAFAAALFDADPAGQPGDGFDFPGYPATGTD